MTLTLEQSKLAEQLFDAFVTNEPLDREKYVGVVRDFATAYQVQDAVMSRKEQKTAGYKVSLTSPETQAMFASDSPLYGAQLADKFLTSGYELDLADYNEPLVEVEMQFTAKVDLTPEMSPEELLANTVVAPALEVPDARFSNWFPKLDKYLVLSDSAVGGAVVAGTTTDGATLKVSDLAEVKATLTHDNQQVGQGTGAEVLGNPVLSLQWLVSKLAEQGKNFPAGTHASTGTFLLPPKLVAGKWQASFTGGFGDVVLQVRGVE
ncbi:2-keto-4-pentenoate hydratase [Leuconostoc miyukkimchii]|uniref:2-keto-4-pentenoate hydratase n=1 Tax=Leuconostoc miyukkimchii TaxID=910540 RepID=UPI001C7DD6F3|nr:2-keto-4-pentenoate hydratase [Leuconostoc miyukkimchii]